MSVTCLSLAVSLAGCSGSALLPRLTLVPSPHERYADALRGNDLSNTALGRDWLKAATAAMAQPLTVTLPMREAGYFAADRPSAVAYRFELQRGRRLSIEIIFESVATAQLFVDLFEVRPDATPRRVASLIEGSTLTTEVPRDGTYLLRVQPELLRSGRYTLMQRTLASLPFPVEGITAAAVQSEFGAARDAGRREHEGLDIFAARNTPVVAVVDGVAQADTNPLGGNVVWLRDGAEPRSFYYAHLSRAAFEGTTRVRAGDVVGYIGNTGNARTTPPHLHFGIYQREAIDPLPFLRMDDRVPPAISDADRWLAELVRISLPRAPLRGGTSRDGPIIAQLDRATPARVVGVTGTVLRVELADRSNGYLDRAAVALARTPLRRQSLRAGQIIREAPDAAAPAIATIAEPVMVDILGEFNGFALIQTAASPSGWIERQSSP
ncbi:MAG TPA: M23 family metallopeptidase [Vicinamibacterales bacterium]|nr:M23 family metallopeptidase [Vicinamibacterales bacterium]